jgi:hypothetical protein
MFDFLKSGSAKVQAEIDTETRRAAEAAATEASLRAARADALLADDTKELDRIDAQLATSARDASRRAERVQLLQEKLEQAQENEQEREIDGLVARADRARKIGEELIRKDYAKQATALALTLLKLRAVDGFIDDLNFRIDRAGRQVVASPNSIRHILPRTEVRTIKKRVGIGETAHPHHDAWLRTNFRAPHDGPMSGEVTLHNGQKVPTYMVVEVEDSTYHAPTWAQKLQTQINELPSASNDQIPLYSVNMNGLGERLQQLQKELDL